jgi:Leucine-rich repeat (LRR) protein
MLGPDRFTFETPNVIDPGDMPPVAPRRESSKETTTPSTHSSSDDDNDSDYQQARSSTARLLRDIEDLELKGDKGFSSYDDDDDDEEHNHHSLPTAEEARLHATSLLSAKKNRRSNLGRSVRIDAPYRKHLLRKRMIHWTMRYGWIPLLLLLLLVVIVVVVVRHRSATTSQPVGEQQRKYNYFVNFLSQSGISSLHHLTTEGTAQHEAVWWLAREDQALPTAVPQDQLSDYRFVQRYVLAVLYFALNGPEWKDQANFLTPQHECAWYAPSYFDQFLGHYYAVGVTCDPVEMRVQDLFLPQNNLKGALPTELMHLMHLKMLSLPGNTVFGEIPSGIQVLSHLTYLDLKYNQISGYIPSWVDRLSNLEVLTLSNNAMEGGVPEALSTLTRLRTLALDDNMFTGQLFFAESLTRLEYFYADRNLFSFTIDDTFLSGLTKLDELDLSSNDISCTEFPTHLLQHPTLDVLDLADNKLQAPLPAVLETNLGLEFLSLRDNRLSGPVPSSLRSLRGLKHLDLQNNALTGKLPLELKELTGLTYLALGYNNFTRTQDLPPFLDELSSLRELSLPSHALTGTIPGWLAQYLPQLIYLDLSYNELKEAIPTNLLQMSSLEILLLNDNQLSGMLPSTSEVANDALQVLTLHHNGNLAGNVSPLCENGSLLMGYDCATSLQCTCCAACCPTDEDCYHDELRNTIVANEGLWEYKYERSPFGMEPERMDANDLFAVLHQQQQP